jgi:hypothetical protein
MADLGTLLERCERDTAALINRRVASRLAAWRSYQDNHAQLVAFMQRVLRGQSRANGWQIHRNGGLSIERIVIENQQLFTAEDVRIASETLGMS